MTPSAALDRIAARAAAITPDRRRLLIAVAGAPASGKSTLAADLVAHLGRRAALVPMDGFHLDNRILDARGLRVRKGAPETFDAAGFVHMIRRLRDEDEVMVPVFDRSRDIAIAGAQVVDPGTDIAVVEGNYLLLDTAPWSDLHALWDLTVFLDVPEAELERRLIQRWLDHDHTPEQARTRALANDLPNARHVIAHSRPAQITL